MRVVVPWRKLLIYIVLVLGAFSLGAVPTWLRGRDYARQRDLAQDELQLSEMENTLSSAVIDARRGEFELARQSTGDFFKDLQTVLDANGTGKAPAVQRERLKALLSRRDHLNLLLARNDPGAGDDLLKLYIEYRETIMSIGPGIES